jgi:general secretion pathway protein D
MPGTTGTPDAPGTGEAGGDTPWSKVNMPQQLETGIEFKRPPANAKFSFNLVDADLVELIKIIGNITGKAFILGAKVPRVKATVYAPTKINADEAYQVFLSVLQVNGLTVMPAGKYLKVMTIGGSTAQNTPIYNRENVPGGDQIVTRLHHLEYISAEELTPVLDRFKSPDGDITVYAPTNMLIITDYGTSIRRLLKLIGVLDTPGTGEQIWIEPINYADATEMAQSIMDVFDVSGNAKKSTAGKAPAAKGAGKKGGSASVVVGQEVTESTISKILADERTNAVIIVASESAYLRILELIKRLDVPIDGEGTMHVMKLQHADAEELAKTLTGLTKGSRGAAKKAKAGGGGAGGEAGPVFEGEVQVSPDKTTNSLLIVASLRDYMSLKAVIEKLDVLQQQVFVEAVLMEVGVDSQRDLGFSFHGGKVIDGSQGKSLWFGSVKPGEVSSTSPATTATLSGLATGVVGPAIPGAEDLVGVSVPAFGVAMQAMQTNSDVNVLATPNIVATDNKEATIQVGQNIPISMGYSPGGSLLTQAAGLAGAAGTGLDAQDLGGAIGGLGGVRYKRQDVGLTLKITPHINDSSQVRLDLDVEATAIKSVDPVAGPNISKKKATTTSVVADQQTVVIGGLIADSETQTTKKVPFLGDIPILGALFRSKTTLIQKQNLIIFLTPYIIRSEEDFRHIFARKMAERREFIERYTVFENHRVDPYLDWSRTSGVVSEINKVIHRTQEDEELRRLSEMSTDVEHARKDPLGGGTPEATQEEEAPPAAVISIKQLLNNDSGETSVSSEQTFEPQPEPSPMPDKEAAAPSATPTAPSGADSPGEGESVPFEMEAVE